jgi:hypothetical protein
MVTLVVSCGSSGTMRYHVNILQESNQHVTFIINSFCSFLLSMPNVIHGEKAALGWPSFIWSFTDAMDDYW